MVKEVIIQTNLSRSILLSIIFIIAIIAVYLIIPSIGFLILLLLAVVVFLQFILTKKISRIIVRKQDQKIIFEYVQFNKKTITLDANLMIVRERHEVHFRGGRNAAFEIYSKADSKKVFEISKRAFKTEEDYQRFVNLFRVK